MSKARNPWIKIILVLAVLAFVVVSIVPLLGNILEASQTSVEATSATPSSVSGQQREDLEKAARGYEAVLQREPDNETALKGLIEIRSQLGDFEGVVEPLEQLAELHPEQPDYMVLAAQTKQRLGDREGAAQSYREILTSHPGNMNALEGLVGLLVQEGRPEQAISVLQDTLKTAPSINDIQPNSVDTIAVQLLLAKVYANQQRYPEAIAIYDDAIEANDQDWRPVLAKAIILKEQGKTEEAQPLFSTAESLAPPQYKDQVKQLATEELSQPTSSPQPEAVEPSEPTEEQ